MATLPQPPAGGGQTMLPFVPRLGLGRRRDREVRCEWQMAVVPSTDSLAGRFSHSRMWRSIPNCLCPSPICTRYGTSRFAVPLNHVGLGRGRADPTNRAGLAVPRCRQPSLRLFRVPDLPFG